MDTKVNLSKKRTNKSNNRYNSAAWVYSGLSSDSIFKKFNTLTDAIKEAIKHTNAHVIQNGTDITYGKITDNVIYYRTNNGEIVMLEGAT